MIYLCVFSMQCVHKSKVEHIAFEGQVHLKIAFWLVASAQICRTVNLYFTSYIFSVKTIEAYTCGGVNIDLGKL